MPARATTVTACIRRHGGWNRTAYSALARLGPPTPEFPWLQADYEQTRQELRVRRAAPRGVRAAPAASARSLLGARGTRASAAQAGRAPNTRSGSSLRAGGCTP